MTTADTKLHADELHIDETLVARLIAAQFPHWSGLPLTCRGAYGCGRGPGRTPNSWAPTARCRPRTLFREAVAVDDATWARGRGWALCFGLMAVHYYRAKGHVLAEVGSRAVGEALAEYEGGFAS